MRFKTDKTNLGYGAHEGQVGRRISVTPYVALSGLYAQDFTVVSLTLETKDETDQNKVHGVLSVREADTPLMDEEGRLDECADGDLIISHPHQTGQHVSPTNNARNEPVEAVDLDYDSQLTLDHPADTMCPIGEVERDGTTGEVRETERISSKEEAIDRQSQPTLPELTYITIEDK